MNPFDCGLSVIHSCFSRITPIANIIGIKIAKSGIFIIDFMVKRQRKNKIFQFFLYLLFNLPARYGKGNQRNAINPHFIPLFKIR